jgi:hypothetical protein
MTDHNMNLVHYYYCYYDCYYYYYYYYTSPLARVFLIFGCRYKVPSKTDTRDTRDTQ